MAQRRKSSKPIAEPPPRPVISPIDLQNYPTGLLVDTSDGSTREGWQVTEGIQILINGEPIAADAGDYVYRLSIPGRPGSLEVLQADVATGMGYEWRPGAIAEPAEGWPFPSSDTIKRPIDEPGIVVDRSDQDRRDPNAAPTGRRVADAPFPHEEERKAPGRRMYELAAADSDRTDELAAEGSERRSGFDRRGPESIAPETGDRRELLERRGAGMLPPPGAEEGNPFDHPSYQTSDEAQEIGPGAVAILETIVRWAKRQTRPWRDLKEAEQDRELADLDRMITSRVQDLVIDIASRTFPYVHATLEKVEFSDGIKATITIPAEAEHRHALADHAKRVITVVLAGAATWTSGERPQPDPDQPKLV